MNWIFDHLQLAIALAIGLAAWIKRLHAAVAQQRVKREGQPKMGPMRMETPPPMPDPAAIERSRQIQQEIRRKIAERTQQVAAEMTKKRVERTVHRPEDALSRAERRSDTSWEVAPQEVLEEDRKRTLAAEIRRLRDERRETLRTARESGVTAPLDAGKSVVKATAIGAQSVGDPNSGLFDGWRAQLNDPDSVRRAIVLNEILGKPVGLR